MKDSSFFSPFLTYYFRIEDATNIFISGSGKVAIANIYKIEEQPLSMAAENENYYKNKLTLKG